MLNKKLIYALSFISFLVIVAIFMALTPEDARKYSGKEQPGIFDSRFWTKGFSGGGSDRQIAQGYAVMKDAVNPQTGKKYTEAEIQRISDLHARFPENDLIPRPYSPEEQKRKKQKKAALEALSVNITAGKASEGDIEAYYAAKKKEILDRLQLVRYLLEEERDQWPEKTIKEYTLVLKHNQKVLKEIDERKKRSLAVLEVRRRNDASRQ